jgi:hypothetical protein
LQHTLFVFQIEDEADRIRKCSASAQQHPAGP